MTTAFPVAVLISGTGTNLQALLDTVHGRSGIAVVAVASNNAHAMGLERASRAGVETGVFASADYPERAARDRAMAGWLEARSVELVVLAGFMELLTPGFLARFPQRVVNVHPALLPAFPGIHAIERQLEHGLRVGGVSVHFVDEGVDTGPIILQEAVEVPYTRDAEEFERRIHEVEHRLLPMAVRLMAAGAVRFDPGNPRVVHVDEGVLAH